MYDQQKKVLYDMQAIKQALPDDKGAVVLAERTWDSFMIPVVAPLHVVAIHETNSTPAADMIHRSVCFDKLYQTLNPSLLKQAKVKYVLARRSEPIFDLAMQKPSLKQIKATDTYVLFKFNGEKVSVAHDPSCYFREP